MSGAQVNVSIRPNIGFAIPPLTSMASSIVRRARLFFPPNTPSVTYGSVGNQGSVLQKVIFDLQSARDFIDLTKLCLMGNFMGQFRADYRTDSSTSNIGANHTDTWYDIGAGPVLDQGTQALIAYLRVMTQQNTIIEEIPSYGLLANIVEAHAESISHKEYSLVDFSCADHAVFLPYYQGKGCEAGDNVLYAQDSASRLTDNLGMLAMPSLLRNNTKPYILMSTPTQYAQMKTFVINLYHSSFLNRCKYFPLKHMNNALRIEITFQDPKKAFYCNYLGTPPRFGGYLSEGHLVDVAMSTYDGVVNGNSGSPAGTLPTPPYAWVRNLGGAYSLAGFSGTTNTAQWYSHTAASQDEWFVNGANAFSTACPPEFTLLFAPGVVSPRLVVNRSGGVGAAGIKGVGDVVAPSLFEARIGQYWMFAYNGNPVTILKVVAINTGAGWSNGAAGSGIGQTTSTTITQAGGSPYAVTGVIASSTPTALADTVENGYKGSASIGTFVTFQDQGSDGSINYNEDVALLQQAYGVWPLAAYALVNDITYGATPNTTSTLQNSQMCDLNCDPATNIGTWGNYQSTLGISKRNLLAYNFNQVWLIDGSANIQSHAWRHYNGSGTVSGETGYKLNSPLGGIVDNNGDYIRPRTAPNLALCPIVLTAIGNQKGDVPGFASPTKGLIRANATPRPQNPSWNFIFQDLHLMADMVLPSDNIRAEYQEMYMSANGINYPFTRVFQNFQVLGSSGTPLQGQIQYVIPLKARSLKTLLVILTDPLIDGYSNDMTSYNFPALSSFRMGGLYEAYLQIGGETYPAHRYRFDISMLQNSHLPEVLSTLDIQMNTNYAPQYHISRLHRESRNYLCYGQFDANSGAGWDSSVLQKTPALNASLGLSSSGNILGSSVIVTGAAGTAGSDWSTQGMKDTTIGRRYKYVDTSRFIMAFNLSRVDNDFMAGVDCAQGTGAVVLFMTFAATNTRQLNLYTYGFCDTVVTVQEAQVLVRV